MTKIYKFEVTGGFDINDKLVEELSYDKRTIGFKLPDGRTVRPCIALEIESEDGCKYEYVTSDKEMAELGFEGLDYGQLGFEAVETYDDECKVDSDGCLIDNDGDAETDME